MVKSRCRKDTSAVGTARIPTVQISSRVRATGEAPARRTRRLRSPRPTRERAAPARALRPERLLPTRPDGAAPIRVPSTPLRTGRETRSPATHPSRPGRRTSHLRRTAGRSGRRVRRPAGTSADVCHRSTGRRVRPARPVSTSWVRMRPPTRSSASRISGVSPASSTFRAAIIPESPAPTMMTSASWRGGCAIGDTLSRRVYSGLRIRSRNCRVRSSLGFPITSAGGPFSRMTPRSVNST